MASYFHPARAYIGTNAKESFYANSYNHNVGNHTVEDQSPHTPVPYVSCFFARDAHATPAAQMQRHNMGASCRWVNAFNIWSSAGRRR